MKKDNELMLVQNGKSSYRIVIPKEFSEVEERAAQEVREYLFKATGAEIAIFSEEGADNPCIYVGHTAFANKHSIVCREEENWRIAVCDKNIVLTGGLNGRQRGVIYAAYHFLEDLVGVRWWNHVEEYVPNLTELKIPADYSNEGMPMFCYRKAVSTYANTDFYWYARNRLNAIKGGDNVIDGPFNTSVRKTGGAFYSGSPSPAHSLPLYFPAEEYFSNHPEWWGWDAAEKRRRSDRQNCLCNEEFYQASLKKLLFYIQTDFHAADCAGIDRPHFFSVSAADDQMHCQCPDCVASVKKSGRSGHFLKFVNRLARDVKKIYPEVNLETLIYWDYIEPPLDDTCPESNVIIRFADLLVDIAHDILSKTNQRKVRMLKRWVELCKKTGAKMYTWEYLIHNFTSIPQAIMYQLPANYQTIYEMGITGCFVENELGYMPDFWCCTQWMLCKYLENPYVDFEETLHDFLMKYYGKAWKAVKCYLDLLHNVMETSDLYIVLDNTCANWSYITPEFVCKGLSLFQEAFDAVSGDAIFEQRLREIELSLYRCIAVQREDLIRIMKRKGTTANLPAVTEACEKVLRTIEEIKNKYEYHIGTIAVHQDNLLLTRLAMEKKVFTEIKNRKSKEFVMPEFLKGTSKEEVYNIPAYEIVSYFDLGYTSSIYDEKADSNMALRYKASAVGFSDALSDPENWRLPIVLTQNAQKSRELLISHADLSDGTYQWFCMDNITEVIPGSNSYLYVYDTKGVALRLNPISEILPFSACDVYVRLKGEGHSFGDSEEKENAICIDRFIIVRRA